MTLLGTATFCSVDTHHVIYTVWLFIPCSTSGNFLPFKYRLWLYLMWSHLHFSCLHFICVPFSKATYWEHLTLCKWANKCSKKFVCCLGFEPLTFAQPKQWSTNWVSQHSKCVFKTFRQMFVKHFCNKWNWNVYIHTLFSIGLTQSLSCKETIGS